MKNTQTPSDIMADMCQWRRDLTQRSWRILDRYYTHACPCRMPRFVYWVTKEQVNTDPLQNNLIAACQHYTSRDIEAAAAYDDSDGGMWSCPSCGSSWYDLCHEKSALNYAHRLKFSGTSLPETLIKQDVPPRVLTGSDFPTLDLWEQFMVEGL
jgi:hypothetical protein